MSILFPDRFEKETYRNDSLISIRAVYWLNDGTVSMIQMPERIFLRFQRIAEAYSLHLIGSASLDRLIKYDAFQCDTVEAEIIFILNIVNDPILQCYGQHFLSVIQLCTRNPQRTYRLVIAGPYQDVNAE